MVTELAPGETLFAKIEFWPSDPEAMQRAVESMPELAGVMTGDHPDSHPLMHKTPTIDYGYIAEGELVLILDDEEITLRQGDMMVQGGANHTWENRTDTKAVLVGVLVGVANEPIDGEPAAAEQ
ncbi:cupin domain-containing protein [Aurantiacibacter sediminis]|uniref:Cupin domain-containing protein n=1 Tax=Aurantiacibacter sediminis TaxID=2793064 RepID=A0ABS0N6R6_9SPHN|nr:cupin domain-containing protein [Aurantiacibacter sediminis]MBH5323458.1 cupin domain-containing protein [Aurantiacibacter sediminis]